MTQFPRSRPGAGPVRTSIRLVGALAAALALSACATPEGGDDSFVHDPFQTTNRDFHDFNKGVDTILLRPTAQAYDFAVPALFKHLIGNGLDMLEMPAIFVNRVLQGEPQLALEAFGRFGINVLMGGVLLDPATEFGLPKENTDMGATFAAWGFEEGPYLDLPVFGPSTTRHAVGRIGDMALNPLSYLSGSTAAEAASPTAAAMGAVEARYENMSAIDRLFYESVDSYVATRSAYIQRRRRALSGGATAESLPDVFGD